MVRERDHAARTRTGTDRSAFTWEVPRDRHGTEFAGIPQGIRVQERRSDGPSKRLSRLVIEHQTTKNDASDKIAGLVLCGLSSDDGWRKWAEADDHFRALCLFVGVVAGADEGAGFDVAEAHLPRLL